MTLRLVDQGFASLAEVERVLNQSKERVGLLLLTETSDSIPKVKPGLSALAYRVLDETTSLGGPLDEVLTAFASQRPKVFYQRLLLDRRDQRVLATLGVAWLPQVRVIKNKKTLFRSSVSIGDNGQFLCQDVGGRSFVRRVQPGPGGFTNLIDALTAEIDRPR